MASPLESSLPGFLLKLLLIFVIFACLMLVGRLHGGDHTDWIATARQQALQPCYPNQTFVRVQNRQLEEQDALTDEKRARYAARGQIIPEGYHEGTIVPELCFAVSDGAYGVAITFWARPRDENGDYDMTIPYWTPSSTLIQNISRKSEDG